MATRQNPELDIIVKGSVTTAWELLGAELGPYVADKTSDSEIASTSDVYDILRTMTRYRYWHRDTGCFTELGPTVQAYANELYEARNAWAHPGQSRLNWFFGNVLTCGDLLKVVEVGRHGTSTQGNHSRSFR